MRRLRIRRSSGALRGSGALPDQQKMTSTNPKFIPIDLKLDTDEMNICGNLFRALVSYVEKFK